MKSLVIAATLAACVALAPAAHADIQPLGPPQWNCKINTETKRGSCQPTLVVKARNPVNASTVGREKFRAAFEATMGYPTGQCMSGRGTWLPKKKSYRVNLLCML